MNNASQVAQGSHTGGGCTEAAFERLSSVYATVCPGCARWMTVALNVQWLLLWLSPVVTDWLVCWLGGIWCRQAERLHVLSIRVPA